MNEGENGAAGQGAIFSDGQELAKLLTAVEWSDTQLGPVSDWTPALRNMLGILLANRFPLLLLWGPQHIQLYNDAFCPVLGVKHPDQAFIRPASVCWPEVWDLFGPIFAKLLQGGPSTLEDDLQLEVFREGFLQECHFTVAYTPVPDPAAPNGIGGVLVALNEITEKHLAERRVLALRDLSVGLTSTHRAEQVCRQAAAALTPHNKDVPFALFYLFDSAVSRAQLAGACGVPMGELISPLSLDLREDSVWAKQFQLTMQGATAVLDDLPGLFGTAPRGPWRDPCARAAVLPIRAASASDPLGFLVVGISVRLHFDAFYRSFFELIAAQIAAAIAQAHALEEARKRADAQLEVDRAKTAFFNNVSHEIRTPLTLMLAPLADSLADAQHPLGPVQRERIPRGKEHLPEHLISAASTANAGTPNTEVYVEAASQYSPATAQAQAPRWRAELASAPRIVWAEEQADMRDYVRRLLEVDFAVEAVADGEAAFAAVLAQHTDLVLADVMMPILDGFGLLRRLRNHPQTSTIPVILLSASTGEESRIEGLQAGADDYLSKPFTARELQARVTTHLNLARLRTQAARAVRASEAFSESLLESSPDCIKLLDSQGRLLRMNASGQCLMEIENFSPLVGAAWSDMWPAATRSLVRVAIEQARSGQFGRFQSICPTAKGVAKWWDVVVAPLRDGQGEIASFIAVSRDISDLKRVETLLHEADRRKDEFIATLSHELRNPLAPLRNALHLLRAPGGDQQPAGPIHAMMERQVDHLVRLVDELLEMSRINRGTLELRKERVNVASIVRNALETSDPHIRARGHRLSVQLPAQDVWLEGDPVRLSQILANLLNNAAKYTEPGGEIAVRVTLDQLTASVSVSDNGAGLSAHALSSIFQMFSRGDRVSAVDQDGLGIGLAFARQLAELHHATLEAYSAGVGQGSEFTLRIALAAEQGLLGNLVQQAAPPELRMRLLVVDDNVDAGDSLAMVLELLGARVRVARGGAEAIALFLESPFDVVILDIGMPGMDGYEVARRLRATCTPQRAELIALTGWGQEDDRRRAREAGFDHHLVKPVDINALRSLLDQLQSTPAAAH